MTSANDFPQRDPRDWRLLGSNDGGKTWTTLDVRSNEVFQARQQRKLYPTGNQTAFAAYRIEIRQVRDPEAASSVQLAEIELLGLAEDDHEPTPVFTDLISAQGDNPPAEIVANLFDRRVETKWLDWAVDQPSPTSWIQWQYATPGDFIVTNIAQLLALRLRPNDRMRVQLEAVVAGPGAPEKATCVVDVTGCVAVSGIDEAPARSAGQKILISGIGQWTGAEVHLKDCHTRVLPPATTGIPERILPKQTLSPGQNLQWVRLEGDIQYPHPAENGISFDVQNGRSSMPVHLWFTGKLPLPPPGTSIQVRGVCRGAFNDRGQWVAADVWAAGPGSITAAARSVPEMLAPVEPADNPVSFRPGTLTAVEQIWRLTQDQLKTRPPVRIRGVITDELQGFVQDETAGIQVAFPSQAKPKIPGFGAYVEVEGFAELDKLGSLQVSASHVAILGLGTLPPPQKLSSSQSAGSPIDDRWVEVDGVVRSTDGSHLLITSYGQPVMAAIAKAPVKWVDALVDADVRARGVAVTARDDQGRTQGIHLLIPSLEYVDVLTPPANPATLPVRKLGTLLGLSGPRESLHRVKVDGVVTWQQNQKLFLQDESGSALAILKTDVVLDSRFGHSRWLYWQSPQIAASPNASADFFPGQRVQVVGFPETHRYSPVLAEATVTPTGDQSIVRPALLTLDGLAEGGLDSRLVTFDGVLRGQTTLGANIILGVEWQDRTIQVLMPKKQDDTSGVQLGSRLRIAGICQIDPPSYPELGLVAGPVRILSRSAADVLVLAQPPWWTLRRALTLVGGMTLVILAGLLWIGELRRQVDERTTQLAAEIRLRERAESRHALERERARIAQDLHDDLGANLTQIIFLSERVEVARHEGQETTHWSQLIPATARHTIQSLDEIVWAINPQHDSLESLANYLSQFAQQHLSLARVRCMLDVPTVLPPMPLSAEIRHNLLLATREALQNVVTHAAATEVRLALTLDEVDLTIAVADNGRGFDAGMPSPAGNGLPNMRRRLQAVGGRLTMSSRSGHGTTVVLAIPRRMLHGRVINGGEVSG